MNLSKLIKVCLLLSFILLLFVPVSTIKTVILWLTFIFVIVYFLSDDEKLLIPTFSLMLLLSVLNTIKTSETIYVFITLFSASGLVMSALKTLEMKQPTNLDLPAMPLESYNSENKKFVASADSSVFHVNTCRYAKTISYSKKIIFNSTVEAKTKGFKPHSCI